MEVGESTDARGQLRLIIATLRGLGLTDNDIACKLVAAAFDGASVYQGTHAGVSALLQAWFAPFVHAISCGVHKLSLCSKALATVPLFEAVCTLLQDYYKYMSSSNKNVSLAVVVGRPGAGWGGRGAVEQRPFYPAY